MTEKTQGLLANAVNGRYSSLKDILTEENVSSVWDSVAAYVEKQLTQLKGVQIPGLGMFCISQRKIEVGNNKFIITQRPVFNVSEKFAQIHGLQFQKYHVPGTIPVLPLNFASISFECPFDRDTVEGCVKELIRATSLAVAAKRNVELCFAGIGRLVVRDGRIKMVFYKEFVNQMDCTGKMVDSLMNRTGTVDSVMSDRASVRPQSSNTTILPRISSSHDNINTANILGNLTPVIEEETTEQLDHVTNETPHSLHFYPELETPKEGIDTGILPDDLVEPISDPVTEHVIENILREGDMGGSNSHPIIVSQDTEQEIILQESNGTGVSRAESKIAFPISKANGVNLTDELDILGQTQKSYLTAGKVRTSHNGDVCTGLKPPTPPILSSFRRSRSFDSRLNYPAVNFQVPTPPGSACGHPSAGQELCYLCHQRAKRNVPVSFARELRRRQEEEDKLLQQYQAMQDAEETLKDQESHFARRRDFQKISAFNLGVAEAIRAKKKLKDTEQQHAYIFNRRPLTPWRVPKQEEYLRELNKQVNCNENTRQKRKADEAVFERLEQMQLAEDLAVQREKYLQHKAETTETYKNALDAQLRAKPLQLPDKEPDNEFFGKNDMNSEKMAERRRKARNLFQEQQSLVDQRKRDAILARLAEQQREDQVLKRAKDDLTDERAFKHMVRYESRKRLEDDWQTMAEGKRARELGDHLRSLSPGILMHEQCDRYKRCRQCMRRLQNCGESNIWSESRFIPGSRIMV